MCRLISGYPGNWRVMMASAPEHRREAERLLADVRAATGDDYHDAADYLPVLLAALVHATLAHNTQVTVTTDQPGRREETPGPTRPVLSDKGSVQSDMRSSSNYRSEDLPPVQDRQTYPLGPGTTLDPEDFED
jgi:hypothetical protein